jgi:predicted secreted protein
MAVIAAHTGAVHYAATDTTGEVGGVHQYDFSASGELLDTTDFADTSGYHTKILGLKDVVISLSGDYNSANAPQALLMTHFLAGTTGYCQVLFNGTAGFKCQTKVADFKITGEVAGVVQFAVTLNAVTALVAV